MKTFYKYLPVTEVEKKWGFYVTTVGYTRINPKEDYPPAQGHPSSHAFTWNKGRILDGYYLVFISRGSGVFESAQTPPSVIAEGTCFFLFPHIWHRYRPDINSGWEEYWVGFKGTHPEQLMNNGFFTAAIPCVRVGYHESLLMLFQRLLQTVQTSAPGYHQIIPGITLEILGVIHQISLHQKQSENPSRQLMNKAMFSLRESMDRPVNMETLARELSISYSKFRKEFKNLTGQSPHGYHLKLRLHKAEDLLNTTTLNINEIAYQTGFESVFYFSKLFKKKTGLSPKNYRLMKA